MYNLVIVPNNSQNFGVGHFDTLQRAVAAQKDIHEALEAAASDIGLRSVSFADDYGTIIDIPTQYISYTAIIDVQKKSNAQIESKIAEAKANKDFAQRVSVDKDLQILQRWMQAAQQPQVIQVAPQAPTVESKPN